MSVDYNGIAQVVEESVELHVHLHLGQEGLLGLRALLRAAREVHRHLETLACPQLVVFRTLDDSLRPLPEGSAQVVDHPSTLAGQPASYVCIQALANGRHLVWRDREVDVTQLSEDAIVYEVREGVAGVLVRGARKELRGIFHGPESPLATPAFSDLRVGLERYGHDVVQLSTCRLLKEVWLDDTRLFLRPGPEADMRRSLQSFLSAYLRDDVRIEVRPEQVVDESHPVDLKVTWNTCNRRAIIEVKWLGRSLNEVTGKVVAWGQPRARKGARQLAEYLDQNLPNAPGHVTRGYLVVIDARRRNLRPGSTTLPVGDALHYEHEEISFDPSYDKLRPDFETPRRMFARPAC